MNHQGYKITKDALVMLSDALAMVNRVPEESIIHPLLVKAQREAIQSQYDELKRKVDEYEAQYPSTTCPHCARTSYNRNDIEHGYCDNCKIFYNSTENEKLLQREAELLQRIKEDRDGDNQGVWVNGDSEPE